MEEQQNVRWASYHDAARLLNEHGGDLEVVEKLYLQAKLSTLNLDEIQTTESAEAVAKLKAGVQLDQVIRTFERIWKSNNTIANGLNLASAYQRTFRIEESIGVLASLLPNYPTRSDLYTMMGASKAMLGDHKECVAWSAKAAILDPSRQFAYAMDALRVNTISLSAAAALYASRVKPVANPNTTPIDGKTGPVYVVAEQGLGDFFLMSPIFAQMARSGKIPVFCSNNEQLNKMAANTPGVYHVQGTSIPNTANVMNMMDGLDYFSYYGCKREPYLTESKDHTPTNSSNVALVNFTGNPKFEYEYARGIYDESVRSEILKLAASKYKVVQLQDLNMGIFELFQFIKSEVARVITTDTMLANMAARMGVPCSIMLHKSYDWRWNCYSILGDKDLYVQDRIGKWGDIVGKLEEGLNA